MPTLFRCRAAVAMWVFLLSPCLGAPPNGVSSPDAPATELPTLLLRNADYLRGMRAVASDAQQVAWQSPAFAEQFVFPLNNVTAIQYPLPDVIPEAEGEFCFELSEGDTVSGQLLKLDERQLEIDSPRFGRLVVDRAHIFRFYRRTGQDLVYEGPRGLDGWRSLVADAEWREVRGQPQTDKPRAALFRDIGLPSQALIDVELSWEKKPDFIMALGVDASDESFREAFRLEVWRDQLVLLRESQTAADLVQLANLTESPGRVRLLLYLDQSANQLTACRVTGERLGQVQVAADADQQATGIRLENSRGDVQLTRLRVTRWSGSLPRPSETGAHVTRAAGASVPGELRSFDAAAGTLNVQHSDQATTIPLSEVAEVMLAPPAAGEASQLQLVYLDGSQLSGAPVAWEAEHLVLRVPSCVDTVRAPLTDVRTISVVHAETGEKAIERSGRAGTLRIDGVQLRGALLASPQTAKTGQLVWQPAMALNGAELRRDAAGRIVYREPPKATPPAQVAQPRGGGLLGGLARIFSGETAPSPASLGPSLHLRMGDRIPCRVSAINSEGVVIRSEYIEQTFVPHDAIKALELHAEPPRLTKSKRERLLTLPRMLRDAPPTHLVRSSNGDFLRGRVESMDDRQLHFEVRLESKAFARNRITHIIWLHADELPTATESERSESDAANSDASASDAAATDASASDPSESDARDNTASDARTSPGASSAAVATEAQPGDAAAPESHEPSLRVQVQRADGIRLTFEPTAITDESLAGDSALLGACRVAIGEIDQLLFGAEIERAAAALPYHRWKLRPAVEPKVAQSSGDASPEAPPAGTESALVNQPAPDFELPTLEGGTYKLSEHKGKVIVLDFFASWCGPCLITMPQVEEVVGEFDEGTVELVGINLEEAPEQVKSLIERHSFKMRVVLDRDGAAAAKYSVSALPQTVVIDREGRIARLFVGGGAPFPEQLRAALRTLVE